MANERRNLDEVSFIRPLVIFTLVYYHATAPWAGIWYPVADSEFSPILSWANRVVNCFFLPLFVFISGYVWSYQHKNRGDFEPIAKLFVKKFKRLIIPCLIFSLVYQFLFFSFDNHLFNNIILLFSGVEHMWFLPMLFWCFMIGWLVIKIKNPYLRWGVTCLIMVTRFLIPSYLGIRACFNYFLYFMMGYDFMRYKDIISGKITLKSTVSVWLLFAVVFVSFSMLQDLLNQFVVSGRALRAAQLEANMLLEHACRALAVVAFYCFTILLLRYKPLPHSFLKMGEYCMGVYLFHQFFLVYIYYHSNIPQFVDQSLLPWLSIIVVLGLSFVCTFLLRKTKLGRDLV